MGKSFVSLRKILILFRFFTAYETVNEFDTL